MNRLLPAALALFLPVASSFAGLEILSASYGTPSEYRDIRDVLEAYVRSKTLSFPVNGRSMGGNRTAKGRDSLVITYKANGREFRDEVEEGKTFTFQGIPWVRPIKAPLGLGFLQRTPTPAPLTIVNRSGAPAFIYCVDRFEAWVWTASVTDHQTIAVTALAGEQWIATDERGRAISRTRVEANDATFIIEPPGSVAKPAGYRGEDAWVRFENAGWKPVYLYTLDEQGRWNWMAMIEPGASFPASTHVGAQWIATSTSNRVLRQTTVAPGLAEVKIQ